MIKEIIYVIYANKIKNAKSEIDYLKNNIEKFDDINFKNFYYCGINKNNIEFHFKNKKKELFSLKLNLSGKLIEFYYKEKNKILNKLTKIDLDNVCYNFENIYKFIYLQKNKMLLEYVFSSFDKNGNVTDFYYKEPKKTNKHIVSDCKFINIFSRSWVRFDLLNRRIVLYEFTPRQYKKIIREFAYYYEYKNGTTTFIRKTFALN